MMQDDRSLSMMQDARWCKMQDDRSI